MLKCRHIMSNDEKQIYRVLKKVICEFARINDPVYDCIKDRVVTTDEENPKIIPRKGEIDKIVSFFYHTYKGEGAEKIQPRIKWFYTGISINESKNGSTVMKTISKLIQYSVTSYHFLL